MELILVVVISAGMAGNSQNGVSRSYDVAPCDFLDRLPCVGPASAQWWCHLFEVI